MIKLIYRQSVCLKNKKDEPNRGSKTKLRTESMENFENLRIVTPLVRTAHKGGERVPAAIGGPKKASNNLVVFKLATIAAFYSETCGAGECFRPKCSGNFQLFSS